LDLNIRVINFHCIPKKAAYKEIPLTVTLKFRLRGGPLEITIVF
jgi:hypothetical protein